MRDLATVIVTLLVGVLLPGAAAACAPETASVAPAARAGSEAAAARFSRKLHLCRVPQLDEDVLCGSFPVPERRGVAPSRTIALNLVVLPARTADVEYDPLVYLAGGGVLPATRYAAMFSRSLSRLRLRRDIVLVDQRGTGRSNPLACPALTRGRRDMASLPAHLDELARCRADLERRADLGAYSTIAAMDDLAEVTHWLGYGRLNLFGMSYGTTAVQTFLKRHPRRVRTIALHGAIPLDVPMWLDLARSAQRSLDLVVQACAADTACRAAYPDVGGDLQVALRRLEAAPVAVTAESPDGAPVEVRIGDRELRDLVNALLTSSRGIGDLPGLVHEAAAGRLDRIAAISAEEHGAPPSPIPKGLFLSLMCSESMSRVDPQAIGGSTVATFVGDFPLRYQMKECGAWPVAAVPADFWTPPSSDVPALLLTGALDNTTPPAYAERVAKGLSNARVITLPWRSHNDGDACVMGLVESFVIAGSGAGLDIGCVTGTPAIRFSVP
jgi:pimeloyl-ACP methyl ester carboxylesterase